MGILLSLCKSKGCHSAEDTHTDTQRQETHRQMHILTDRQRPTEGPWWPEGLCRPPQELEGGARSTLNF